MSTQRNATDAMSPPFYKTHELQLNKTCHKESNLMLFTFLILSQDDTPNSYKCNKFLMIENITLKTSCL